MSWFLKTFLSILIICVAFTSRVKAQGLFCDNETCYGENACYTDAQLSVRTYKYATVHNVYGSSTASADLFMTVYSPCLLPDSIDNFQTSACNNCAHPFILMIHGGGFRVGC